MKVNTDKSHHLMSGNKTVANIDNNRIESANTRKLLGITIDSKLTFDTRINKICKKKTQKRNALVRISNYMALNKR